MDAPTGALLVTMPLPAAAYTCAMSPADTAWLDAALENWRSSERLMLKLASAALLCGGHCADRRQGLNIGG